MTYFVTTPLGRRVLVDDWEAYHTDTIMRLLDAFAASQFNPEHVPLDLASIVNSTGLDPIAVISLCGRLRDDGYVEEPVPDYYRITERGAEYVRQAPGRFDY